jgi:NAD(P)-dependent dehydrogenase (short-subunit alcohol dehydrogenase family)
MIDINFRAVVNGTQMAIIRMRKLKKPGVIINTASAAGIYPFPANPIYAATKAAVIHFTVSISQLTRKEGIRIGCICPVAINTNFLSSLDQTIVQTLTQQTGGLLQPEEVAEGMLQLASEENRWMSILSITKRNGIKKVSYWERPELKALL